MKKILGLLLCMGIFLSGLTVAYGSPPGNEKAQHETVVTIADAPTIETLALVSHQAAAQATAELASDLSRVTDMSFARQMIAELRANTVNRKLVARLINKGAVHRWRDYSNTYAPANKIYHLGWNRKVCEG